MDGVAELIELAKKDYAALHVQPSACGLRKLTSSYYTKAEMRLALLARRRGSAGFVEATVVAELRSVDTHPALVALMVKEYYGDGWEARYAPSRHLTKADADRAVAWAKRSGTESGFDDAPWAEKIVRV